MLGRGVNARGKIIEQQNAGVKRQSARQHDALLLPAREAGTALGDDRIQPLRQCAQKVIKLGGTYGLGNGLVARHAAKGDIFAHAQVKDNAVLEYESDLVVEGHRTVLFEQAAVILDCAACRRDEPHQYIEELRFARGSGPDDRRLGARGNAKRNVFKRQPLVEPLRNVFNVDVAFDINAERAGALLLFGGQHFGDAVIGSLGLRYHVAHKADDDNGEDKNGEVAVKRRKIAQGHGAIDDKASAQSQNDERCHVGGKGNNGDERCKEAQDAHADIFSLSIGGHKLFSLGLVRVQKADKRCAQNAFVNDFVEPVDSLLRAAEELAHAHKHQIERDADDRHDNEHGQRQLPVY